MAEFVAAWDAATDGAPADYYGLLSWTFADAVHQVLEEAVAGGDLSRAGISTALERIDVLQFDGLTGDYGYGPGRPTEAIAHGQHLPRHAGGTVGPGVGGP